MTRLFTDGAEFGDMLFWNNGGTSTASTAYKRSGAYSYKLGSDSMKAFTSGSEIYFRCALNHQGGPYGSWNAGLYYNSTAIMGIGFGVSNGDVSPKAKAWLNGAIVASGSTILAASTWHLLEVYFKMADTNGRIIIKANGLIEVDYTGDTKPGTDTMVNYFVGRNGWGDCYMDDIALNNINGETDNSWCGDGHIEILLPNTDGDTIQWTPSSGSVHYSLVDEIPPVSTDYVTSGCAGYQDMYHLSTFSGTGKSVKRIWSEIRGKDNTASGGYMKLGFKTSGCTILSSASSIMSSNFSAVVGDNSTTNPVTEQPWGNTDLNALQFVMEAE